MPGSGSKAAKKTKTCGTGECILLVESRPAEAVKILEELHSPEDESYRMEWAIDLSSGIQRLCAGGVGAVVLNLTLPDCYGIETFDKLHQAAPHVPILVLSEMDAEETAKQAVQRGARDYLLKNRPKGYLLSQAVKAMVDHREQEALLGENESTNVTLNSMGQALIRVALDNKITYLNQAAEQMTGWLSEDARGRPVTEVFHLLGEGNRGVVSDVLQVTGEEGSSELPVAKSTNAILVRRDGFKFEIENKVTPVRDRDRNVTGAILSFCEQSTAQITALKIMRSVEYDPLTNLPNRILFHDRLTQALSLAERQHAHLAVMFIDLDAFKRVNDSLGHTIGDKLLQSVAERLTTCVRRSDTVGRIGGDEFVILLSQVERAEDAAFSARKILRSLKEPHRIDGLSLDLSASIGISAYPVDGETAEALMNRADNAMYEAKKQGRNTYQFFQYHMHLRLAERQSLESDLRCALGRKEFLLHYQAIVSLTTGKITGMEALLRWLHPKRGLISPAQFIPIAEECGLMSSLGGWVLLEACKQARSWKEAGLGDISISINVSASEFASCDFLSTVRASLIATGIDPRNLELELTEGVLMVDPDLALVTLSALKAIGVRIAIDDFGTGYSSFTYLRRFPTDTLKIHQSFVQEIAIDPKDAAIVRAMVDIGKSLKQRVVAEGIETGEQLNFLQCQGCDEGQGYYFSRPVAAATAGGLLRSGIASVLVN